ncbi:MAG TPA: MlaD family protein [Thermoleophilaceae bacterium]|nr:MlaD family protein [Thermoleophilaceae bacterium]
MIKQAPSLGRIFAMVAFALSVFGLLMFLWLAFGGPIPIKPEGYRLTAHFKEAATLAVEADVRMAGVNIGKVKKKELDKRGVRTIVELELKPEYAPVPKDTKAILRQKTLFGETYVELTTASKKAGILEDGKSIPNTQIEPTVELDEIFTSFDEPTRRSFQEWMRELAKASRGESSQHLNDAFGNLEGFAVDGAKLLRVLDEQEIAVRRMIKNTGVVFGALNERQGALRGLIQNSHDTFEATASRDEALAETFLIFPTFLDESRVTLSRLERFANNTRPLVNRLKAPADDLGPTVRDLGDLAPDLTRLFRNLPPLIRAADSGVPDLERVLEGLEPVVEAAHVFFPELNPILSYFNFHQTTITGFLMNGAADISGDFGGERYQTQVGIIDGRSFRRNMTIPPWARGNAYLAPNALQRGIALGTIESFDCDAVGGEQVEPADEPPPPEDPEPPCFEQPPSLYNGQQFVVPQRGRAPLRDNPSFRNGSDGVARDPHPEDPLH